MIDDMQVYIANLGKYNEGELVGGWFSFPLDEEVIAERIGLNAEYEEYAIHDTDNFPMEISEYISISELNRIYEQLEELPDYLLDDLDSFVSYYGSLEELVEHKDDIILYSGCETMTDLAYYLIDEEQSLGEILSPLYRGHARRFHSRYSSVKRTGFLRVSVLHQSDSRLNRSSFHSRNTE